MCIEDIRIGRHTQCRIHQDTAAAAGSLLIAGQRDRIALCLGSHATVSYVIIPQGEAASSQGFHIAALERPVVLRVEDFGELVYGSWWVQSLVGDIPIIWTETLYLGDQAPPEARR